MTTLAEHADALRDILDDLSTLTVEHLTALWRQYGDNPEILAILQAAFPELVGPYAQSAAAVTAQWYDELAPTSEYQAQPVVDLAPDRLDQTIRWALFAPGITSPLNRLAGSSKRMVLDAARDTVTVNAEEEGVQWVRHAQPDACAFCRMLATRTNVFYSSEQSAKTVVGRGKAMSISDRRARAAGSSRKERGRFAAGGPKLRGVRKFGDKYHDHCRCEAVPVRQGSVYVPPPHVAKWTQEYTDAFRGVPDGTSYADNAVVKAVLKNMRATNPTAG